MISIFVLVLLFVGKYVYDMNINHNFENYYWRQVYKSGVIPPDDEIEVMLRNTYKSIVDLRCQGQILALNQKKKLEKSRQKERCFQN
jgi:hypothetical protein